MRMLSASAICSATSRIGDAFPAADVDRQPIERVGGGRQQIGARDVFHEREIARLLAVFVEDRREIVEQTRAEDRDHAGVGIEDRLARTVGAGVAQRDGRNARLFAPEQDQPFLIDLR